MIWITVFINLNKDPLANFVETFAKIRSIDICRSTAGMIGDSKNWETESSAGNNQIEKGGALRISSGNRHNVDIKSAWSDIIKENSNTNSASVYLVKQVAKSVVAGDEITRNLIIYGEKDGGDSEAHE